MLRRNTFDWRVMKHKTYLFAYGTLRKGFDVDVKNEIAKDLIFIETGKVKARLYDLGFYPGAVKTNDENEIEGDVFALLNANTVFQILDEYEGDEYERALTTVTMDSGDETDAWIYWYKGEVNEGWMIAEKDYRSYLKTKDSLR